jgi:hypothetical protein
VSDFRRIEAHLPNPVPAGLDPKRYFSDNYDKLGADPVAYGWFQLYMVISVYDEPAKSFQHILDVLPNALRRQVVETLSTASCAKRQKANPDSRHRFTKRLSMSEWRFITK